MKHRRTRRGHYLPPRPSEDFIAPFSVASGIDRQLTAAGFERKATVRPYLALNQVVSVRFVWRKREDGHSAAFHMVLRFPSSDPIGAKA